MGDIYRTAYRVLVWLGDAGDDSDMLFDYQSQRFAGPINGNRKARLKTAFEALCSRPYWRRVWIIQEVLIAYDLQVLCGTRLMSWSKLFWYLLRDQAGDAPDPTSYFQLPENPALWPLAYRIVRLQEYRGGAVHSLSSLLQLCLYCGSQCEDIRDRVYGVLGVTDSEWEITPDYSRSDLQLYIAVFRTSFLASAYLTLPFSLTRDLQNLLGDPLWDENSKSFHGTSILDHEPELAEAQKGLFMVNVQLVANVEFVSPVMNRSHLDSVFEFQRINTDKGKFRTLYDTLKGSRRTQTIPSKFQELQSRFLHQTQEIGGRYSTTSKTRAIPRFECGTLSLGRGHNTNTNPCDCISPVSRMKSSPAWKIADLIDGGTEGPTRIGRAVTRMMNGKKGGRFSSLWLERALELSCDSLCHDRKDKVYGMLGLAEDVRIGDIPVDYSQSLFALCCRAILFYQDMIKKGASFQNPRRRSIVRFSQVLQKALLGPDFDRSAFADMRHRTLEDLDLESTSTRFLMYGRAESKVVAVLHTSESVRRSCLFAREIMSDLEKSRFDLILGDIDKILQSDRQVICFITDKKNIGTGHRGIQAKDVVWRDESVKGVRAIIRNENERHRFVSGIRFLTGFRSPVDAAAGIRREQFIMVEVNILQLQEITCPKVAEVP